jgi:hypothetical protein
MMYNAMMTQHGVLLSYDGASLKCTTHKNSAIFKPVLTLQ